MKKRQILLALLLLIFFCTIGFAGDYEDFISKGDKHYHNMDILNALKQYEKAYSLNPDNYTALSKLTRVYNDHGEELIELDNDKRAEVYIKKAIDLSEKHLARFPDSSQSYTYRALSLGNYAMFVGGNEKIKLAHQIEKNAKKAIKLNPNDYLPYIILGIYFREIASLNWLERAFADTFLGDVPEGTLEDSERMLKKAFDIDGDMIIIHYQFAKTYRRMNNKQQEIKFLKKVLELPVRDFRDKFSKAKSERRLKNIGG